MNCLVNGQIPPNSVKRRSRKLSFLSRVSLPGRSSQSGSDFFQFSLQSTFSEFPVALQTNPFTHYFACNPPNPTAATTKRKEVLCPKQLLPGPGTDGGLRCKLASPKKKQRHL